MCQIKSGSIGVTRWGPTPRPWRGMWGDGEMDNPPAGPDRGGEDREIFGNG
ncbi:MAG: hypothetical protein F6K48_10755 [Okeania sp. SIO3H1]|uniref:hypothetical protein n=1 Tax=Okeania sp. SIO1I7 TaxID=2607772 RepID=UPI0013CC6DDE|nr:hypothetical protein [Okeania sp. SIO1I7]NEN89346.1 hypothetical protein [Okeania sp. SIO3H1]NET25083.1 hypothetical protein [Okeania sp. SIO1I7]